MVTVVTVVKISKCGKISQSKAIYWTLLDRDRKAGWCIFVQKILKLKCPK